MPDWAKWREAKQADLKRLLAMESRIEAGQLYYRETTGEVCLIESGEVVGTTEEYPFDLPEGLIYDYIEICRIIIDAEQYAADCEATAREAYYRGHNPGRW